jgi:protein-S-isoprenylcysteine O-methyltransferase Ste14
MHVSHACDQTESKNSRSKVKIGMKKLELRVPPLALVLISACLMAVLAYAVPMEAPLPYPLTLAMALLIAGAAVASAGVIAFKKHSTTVNPFTPDRSTALVNTGVYRYTRNPMYLGFLLALVAWGVYLSNATAYLLLPVFVMYMNRFQIQPEERALESRFGQQFVVYKESVRRWL